MLPKIQTRLRDMAIVDLVLRNCRLVKPLGFEEAGLAIDDGEIVSIAKDPLLPGADKVFDARGNIVVPGGIDAHVHFMDPGYTYREDWGTGSASAVAGGVTLVIDHGLTNPPSTTVENLRKIKAEAGRKSVVDYGLNGAVVPSNLDELPELWDAGVAAFGEIFMAESVPELESVDDGVLLEAFQIIRRIGGLAGVHAENSEIVSRLTSRLRGEGRNDPLAHVEARPSIAEAEAVSRALMLAKDAGVHCTSFTSRRRRERSWSETPRRRVNQSAPRPAPTTSSSRRSPWRNTAHILSTTHP